MLEQSLFRRDMPAYRTEGDSTSEQMVEKADEACFPARRFTRSHQGTRYLSSKKAPVMVSRRGVGLLYALALGAILVGLASFVAVMTRQRIAQMQRTQWALQARLNAQSGFNQYCRDFPPPTAILDFGVAGRCEVQLRDKDLWFIGSCHGVKCALMAPAGDVRRVHEEDLP